MVSPVQPSQTETRPSLDDQPANYSKIKASSKNSVHLSAVSTSNSMEPPSPPPPPPPASSGTPSRNAAGQKGNQNRRAVPQSPVLLRIDASAQGFHSGGNSPLESSPISFQVAQSGSGHYSYPGAPVQVTAQFSSPKAPRSSSNGGGGSSTPTAGGGEMHHHPQYHQHNSYQPAPPAPQYHQSGVPSAAPAAFVTMPGQTTMLPVYTTTTTPAAGMPQHATHYYTGHQAAFPTMVPFHMPGSYAVGYTPATIIGPPGGVAAAGGQAGIEGEGILMDPMLASQYQAAQYHAMFMQQFMQHNLNMQQQQQHDTGNHNSAAGGGGRGGGRNGNGSSYSQYANHNQYQPYQNQKHSSNASFHRNNTHYQPQASLASGGSGGGNSNNAAMGGGHHHHSYRGGANGSYPSTYNNSTTNNNNNNDIALPGIAEGPEAEIFQAAVRESGALSSSLEKSTSGGSGGSGSGGQQDASHRSNEFLTWVRKTLVSIDGGLGSGSGGGGIHAHHGAPSSSSPSPSSLVLTLDEMRGNLVVLSRDQIGSRVLQTAMEGMSSDDLKSLFEEIQPKLEVLMADQFGNYVIQRLLDSRVKSIVISIGEALKGRVLPFSLHVYGCRVVQKALDALPQEQRVVLAAELQPFTLHCLSDQNANHVIQKCLETVQPSDGVREMVETIAKHALTLARHSFGCRAVQRLLQYCTITEIYDAVIDDVLYSILDLTKNQFGNYVVQHLVAQGPENTRNAIMEVILPLSSSLACHKFASNVMEACLEHGPENKRSNLIQEFLQPSDPNAPTVAAVARDQFGNYVLQRALEVATDEEKWQLVLELQPHLESLRRSGYGKHIASRVGKMLIGMNQQRQQQEIEQEKQQRQGEKEAPSAAASAKEESTDVSVLKDE